MLWLVIGIVAVVVLLISRSISSLPPASDNPNANNPDALEAALDPEGGEPEGY